MNRFRSAAFAQGWSGHRERRVDGTGYRARHAPRGPVSGHHLCSGYLRGRRCDRSLPLARVLPAQARSFPAPCLERPRPPRKLGVRRRQAHGGGDRPQLTHQGTPLRRRALSASYTRRRAPAEGRTLHARPGQRWRSSAPGAVNARTHPPKPPPVILAPYTPGIALSARTS